MLIYHLFACTRDSELGNKYSEKAYCNMLIKGFKAGHLYLDTVVPEGLTKLKDPYNAKENYIYQGNIYSENTQRLHDLTYYKGRLYLYFGVIPAVVLFLPYNILTGSYISHQEAVFVFASIGFLSMLMLIYLIWSRYYDKCPRYLLIGVIISLGLGSGIPIVLNRPDVWEIPILSGYAFTSCAVLTLFWGICYHSLTKKSVFLISLFCMLAVGSRPNLILAVAVILIATVWQIYTATKTNYLSRLCIVTATTLCLGSVLLFYNYIRYDDVFEFGQRYQLADDNQNIAHFKITYLISNLYLYFIAVPEFCYTNLSSIINSLPSMPRGHAEVDSFAPVLTSMPFVLLCFTLGVSLYQNSNYIFKYFISIVALIFLLSCFLDCLFYGTCVRYEIDFIPYLYFLAAIGALGVNHLYSGNNLKSRLLQIVTLLLIIASISSNLVMAFHFRALKLYEEGATLIQYGDYSKARDLIKSAKMFDNRYSKESIFNNNLGIVLYRCSNVEEAESAFKAAIDCTSTNPRIYKNYADVLIKQGKSKLAKEALINALELNPNYTEAKVLLEGL